MQISGPRGAVWASSGSSAFPPAFWNDCSLDLRTGSCDCTYATWGWCQHSRLVYNLCVECRLCSERKTLMKTINNMGTAWPHITLFAETLAACYSSINNILYTFSESKSSISKCD